MQDFGTRHRHAWLFEPPPPPRWLVRLGGAIFVCYLLAAIGVVP
ncbi:MAG: hypothetical protein AB7N70_36330 [Dehalococcoidia bacterium]